MKIISNSSYMGFNSKQPLAVTSGTNPITWSISKNNTGGSIDSSGLYTAGTKLGIDQIRAIDASGLIALTTINVGTIPHLVCDIIQKEMSLDQGRVFLWDQKIIMPTDEGLFVVVEVADSKSFGVTNYFDNSTNTQVQSVNMKATLSIDCMSRGPDARDLKEQVLLALSSNYAEQQQELNSFQIGKVSTGFTNLSNLDGTAIPYRFNINVVVQYQVTKTTGTGYFDAFQSAEIVTN
jgi:hypothetical protein